jgi:hypothetical protein
MFFLSHSKASIALKCLTQRHIRTMQPPRASASSDNLSSSVISPCGETVYGTIS